MTSQNQHANQGISNKTGEFTWSLKVQIYLRWIDDKAVRKQSRWWYCFKNCILATSNTMTATEESLM